MKQQHIHPITLSEHQFINTQRLSIAYKDWLGEKSKTMTICACWQVPDAMRRHYNGHTAQWLAKELRRYFNKIDRRIFKAAHKNRGMRLQRIISLEYDEHVGWHAHGMLECAHGKDGQETIDLLEHGWLKHTERFASNKFEKHVFWADQNKGSHHHYIIKRMHREDDLGTGFLDTMNTSLSSI